MRWTRALPFVSAVLLWPGPQGALAQEIDYIETGRLGCVQAQRYRGGCRDDDGRILSPAGSVGDVWPWCEPPLYSIVTSPGFEAHPFYLMCWDDCFCCANYFCLQPDNYQEEWCVLGQNVEGGCWVTTDEGEIDYHGPAGEVVANSGECGPDEWLIVSNLDRLPLFYSSCTASCYCCTNNWCAVNTDKEV